MLGMSTSATGSAMTHSASSMSAARRIDVGGDVDLGCGDLDGTSISDHCGSDSYVRYGHGGIARRFPCAPDAATQERRNLAAGLKNLHDIPAECGMLGELVRKACGVI